MIEIRSHFMLWHNVDLTVAKKYVNYLMEHITNIPLSERKQYIEVNYLKGVTINELHNLS